jgi:glycerate 2-kinase
LIKNSADLERLHGRGAKIALGAMEAAIKSVDPGMLVKRAVKVRKNSITFLDIHGRSFTIKDFGDIYVVGAGKAAAPMAAAMSKILKRRITDGAINVPRGSRATAIDNISITYASHPVPDERGANGTKKIIKLLERKAGEKDLVIVLISGGGSALLPLPADGLSLSDKQNVTRSLLASGASIHEINTVRKHLSAVKGGQLARHIRCRAVSLILSDVVGDDLAVIASGPTFPDPTTYTNALEIVRKYTIRNARITRHLTSGAVGKLLETPKPGDPLFNRLWNIMIGNNSVACESAVRYLADKVPAVENLGSEFDGEAKNFGKHIAKVISSRAAPFAIVAGGETTVKLGATSGKGGRNQEAALACALAIKDIEGITAAFVGSDGIDGNSDAAGAIVSTESATVADQINARHHLLGHDSYSALKRMQSLIFTGYTGTNVNDIAVALRLNRV